jgi:PadR family transcriptional regulator PadR
LAVVVSYKIGATQEGGAQMQGISSDVIRGYNDTMILYLLIQNPSYGYEITKQIKRMTDEKYIIKETTLYSAFARMEKNGYITSFSSEEINGKRRTYYRITEAGTAYYREKCEEWLLTKEVVGKFIMSGEN